jgi:hypothetical protein
MTISCIPSILRYYPIHECVSPFSLCFTLLFVMYRSSPLSMWDTLWNIQPFCDESRLGHIFSMMMFHNGTPVKLHPWSCRISFLNASCFNQTLCWDVSKVTNDTDYYGFPRLSIFDGSLGSFATEPYPECLVMYIVN